MKKTRKKTRNEVRLTTDVVPTKYEISLKPDLKKFVFEGEETIHITLKRPTRQITLHSKELKIKSAVVVEKKGEISAQKITYDEKAETATFIFKDTLPKGSIRLKILFRGILNDKMHGFYRSSYVSNGKTHHLAVTQLESTDARRAFPCFDEPAMKAVFDIALVIPEKSTAISNTVVVRTTAQSSGYKTVHFAPTPRMSTYLLAFIVGDFEYIEKKSTDGVLVRVFTTPGKKHQAAFALDCAAKTISFFNTYFDIPYPMPVLNMIAIPDFSAGAMENWGAITYRESALLVDKENSSTMNKQWVALVIAHEIAHQWFGNLVTMEWWTHLWLNEGFASYIEYLAVDHVFPKWDIWTQFLHVDFSAAMHADGLKHTHPIEVEVHHPREITAVFDAVSYSKGASIIRMIAEYLGEKDFRDGLRYYLKKHRYGNTSTTDLWNALQKISGKPVGKIMANWTGKAGYPLLTISESGKYFNLKQSRFFASPLSEKHAHDHTLWHVPVSFQTGSRKRDRFIMNGRTVQFQKADKSWIKLNVNESGFYRTQYSDRLRGLLAEPIRTKRLKTRDRLGLARDIMALAEPGKLSTVDGLQFATHYAKENEYVVWTAVSGGLAKIHSLIAHEQFLKEYETFALEIFTGIRKKTSWNTKPKKHSDALLKVLVLASLGKYGDIRTIDHARKLFASIKGSVNAIPADLRGVVYSLVARYGNAKEYAKLLRLYRTATLHEEKNRIGSALGNFRQKDLLQKTLAFAISKGVRRQDSVRMISSVTINPEGTELAWSFMKRNWKVFLERYGASREVSYLLSPLSVSTSVSTAKDIERFLKKNPAPGTERTVRQVLEQIRYNAAWLARDRKKLSEFLSK
ncbi:aminopeptidase [Candidatus Kaiserbacteria bacterium CG10_big_fil_rev_8_21_14_0_10_51_14]|uniref:Aminopeptidase n=1 Tax=Candidatus Kaiserbacteria bacterium CG10_big_fil_rev_8_21_14_0_10_51_14 TaxID=1974610 RepID=A0A2H0UB43_9BACT|nr:MAG: aminopeptidase [Candidatus Kaiserbacteria bacterium CG10_big_fil_rev_8_21_14_0_10_51_14]